MRRRTFLVGLPGLVAGVACGTASSAQPSATVTSNDALRPASPLAANPLRAIWPAAYRSAPRDVRDAYDYAIAHGETLRWIACFCGCGAQGHKDNFDCYVARVAAGGWVVLDTHGFG